MKTSLQKSVSMSTSLLRKERGKNRLKMQEKQLKQQIDFAKSSQCFSNV